MEQILSPDIKLIKQDEFYLFYEMMMQALRTDNVKEGLNKSLYLLRKFLNSGSVSLYKKNSDGLYVFQNSDSQMNDLILQISSFVNQTKNLTEKKSILNLNLDLSERFKNLLLVNVKTGDSDYIVSIVNSDESKELEPQFWERLKDTIQIILKRANSYERNIAAISTDLLTGLDNRNSYEMRIQSINEADEDLVLGIFDLFRLKYINDNYTHTKGDLYIKKVADILSKYWPKQQRNINDDMTESFTDTGHCVYRIGGDEFVLLTNVDNYQLACIKGELVRDEASIIDLELGDNIPIGLNLGIVKHVPGESFKETFNKADQIMQEEKSQMYKTLKLERRQHPIR